MPHPPSSIWDDRSCISLRRLARGIYTSDILRNSPVTPVHAQRRLLRGALPRTAGGLRDEPRGAYGAASAGEGTGRVQASTGGGPGGDGSAEEQGAGAGEEPEEEGAGARAGIPGREG